VIVLFSTIFPRHLFLRYVVLALALGVRDAEGRHQVLVPSAG
jgi:hypothetical protein